MAQMTTGISILNLGPSTEVGTLRGVILARLNSSKCIISLVCAYDKVAKRSFWCKYSHKSITYCKLARRTMAYSGNLCICSLNASNCLIGMCLLRLCDRKESGHCYWHLFCGHWLSILDVCFVNMLVFLLHCLWRQLHIGTGQCKSPSLSYRKWSQRIMRSL